MYKQIYGIQKVKKRKRNPKTWMDEHMHLIIIHMLSDRKIVLRKKILLNYINKKIPEKIIAFPLTFYLDRRAFEMTE